MLTHPLLNADKISTMPHLSLHKQQLQALKNTHNNLIVACYVKLINHMINELIEEADSEDESDISSLSSDKSMLVSLISSDSSWSSLVSGTTGTNAYSLLTSQPSSDGPEMATPAFTEFIDMVCALHDEAQKSYVLNSRPKIPHTP